jgi:hypothetical protein
VLPGSILRMTLFAVTISGKGSVVGPCLSALLYVRDTVSYSSWSTRTIKHRLQITPELHTGFCRLDFLSLLQTPRAYTTHSHGVHSRALPVAPSVTCLGLLLESEILWESDLRWLPVKCKHSLNTYVRHFVPYTLILIIKYHPQTLTELPPHHTHCSTGFTDYEAMI